MSKATLTSKGQITIPQKIRVQLGLKQGDQVSFELEDGKMVMKPLRGESNPFESYAGALGSFKTKKDVKAWLRDLRDED